MAKTRKQYSKSNNEKNDYTYHGLHKWFESKFEKLGWMILAKQRGMTDKVLAYQNSVKLLHDALFYKSEQLHDKDRKNDIMIMKRDVEILMEHIKQDF